MDDVTPVEWLRFEARGERRSGGVVGRVARNDRRKAICSLHRTVNCQACSALAPGGIGTGRLAPRLPVVAGIAEACIICFMSAELGSTTVEDWEHRCEPTSIGKGKDHERTTGRDESIAVKFLVQAFLQD
eukprot:g5063.t1 g5063   contig18:544622-545011(-)